MNFNRLLDYFSAHCDATEENFTNKGFWLNQLVAERMIIREILNRLHEARKNIREMHRQKKKLEEKGVRFIFSDAAIEAERQRSQVFENALIAHTERLSVLLDMWQDSGAVLSDLCNFCNRDIKIVLPDINDINERFGKIVFIHNLDYKDDRTGWIEDEVDAPLTHAFKEYAQYQIIHNPMAKSAARSFFMEQFPEAVRYIREGEDGEEHLYDIQGNDLGIVEKAEENS